MLQKKFLLQLFAISPLCVILLLLNPLHLFDFIVIVCQLCQRSTAFSSVFKRFVLFSYFLAHFFKGNMANP